MEKCTKCGKTAVTSWTTLEKKCTNCGARFRKVPESSRRSSVNEDSYVSTPTPSFDSDYSYSSPSSDSYSSGGGDFGGGGSSSDW